MHGTNPPSAVTVGGGMAIPAWAFSDKPRPLCHEFSGWVLVPPAGDIEEAMKKFGKRI
jgi:hypothetical protein